MGWLPIFFSAPTQAQGPTHTLLDTPDNALQAAVLGSSSTYIRGELCPSLCMAGLHFWLPAWVSTNQEPAEVTLPTLVLATPCTHSQ
jgi:hypothetical protein